MSNKLLKNGKNINKLTDLPVGDIKTTPEKQHLYDLIDKAAVGDDKAAGEIAEGYLLGTFEETPNYEKAKKWAHYAIKRGNPKGEFVWNELKKLGYPV